MTDEEPENKLLAHITWLYDEILKRPQMFCNVVAIENYILAVESLVDTLVNAKNRPAGYKAFLGAKQFGARTFESMFSSQNNCVLRFVDINSGVDSGLGEKYLQEFIKHWKEFLEWRTQQVACEQRD